MQLITRTVRTGERGFSLIEVMVALIVICVGLLGVAKLQALALSNMTTSRLRALAAFEAAGLAAAMHSNQSYWASQPGNFAPIVFSPLATPKFTSADANLSNQASNDYLAGMATGGSTACVGTLGGGPLCGNSTNLAAYDLARWGYSLTQLLPNPTATINCPVAPANTPVSCSIEITWTEKAVAMTAQEATQQAAGNNGLFEIPTYWLYVQP